MLKQLLLIGIALACFGCGDKATLTIGRGTFDPGTKQISDMTDSFLITDVFHLTLVSEKPFHATEYELRLSKKDAGLYRTISTEKQPLTGTYRGFHREFPIAKLKESGTYKVEILMKGKVIGSRDFKVRL